MKIFGLMGCLHKRVNFIWFTLSFFREGTFLIGTRRVVFDVEGVEINKSTNDT